MPAPLKRRLSIFLLIVIVAALAYLAHWFWVARFIEHTNNAYVQGEITRVSSQLGARIDKILVQDNQHVTQGELLAVLDATDFQIALERAKANLATREAQVEASSANLGRTQLDLNRAQALRKPGYVSEERVTSLSADSHVAKSNLSKSQADLQAQRQQVATLEAEIARLEAQVATARSDIAQAELNLSRTQIHAPISGLVGQRSARSGQVVQAGAYLLSLVPDEDIWVQANFKETQIGKMTPGQKAELIFDSFPDTPIEANVESLFAASGAQFSLLPPDNATGNFTKVVQRIPVKLTFAANNPLHGRIRPGMSVEVKVDVRGAE
jgi:membrane fusion protein (multidrug efflux system)